MPEDCRHDRRSGRAELADIVRIAGPGLASRIRLSGEQRVAMAAIARCRTPESGGHVEICTSCGHRRAVYRSCRNRHCPKCCTLANKRWLQARVTEVLPAGYLHVVFTLPHSLHGLARSQPRAVYEALFRAASQTLLEFASDPRHLGARPGITAILHTWTQRLDLHIHLHCIVTAGGLDPTGRRWVKPARGLLFPVRALSRVFRGKYLDALRPLMKGPLDARTRADLYLHDWVVYAKAPPAGPAILLDYLARYTHRVVLGNERILDFDGRTVILRWRDSLHHNRKRILRIDAESFLARFLQHVLPHGFKRVRHYGILAPAVRTTALAACRHYFGITEPHPDPRTSTTPATLLAATGRDPSRCERCGAPTLRRDALAPTSSSPSAREPP